MTQTPAGDVDPLQPEQVVPVLAAVLRSLGIDGMLDLMARIPGLAVVGPSPGGRFRRPTPPRVSSGEMTVIMGTPAVCEHVVGGITLSRQTLTPRELAEVLASMCRAGVTESGEVLEASLALTAVRDAIAT